MQSRGKQASWIFNPKITIIVATYNAEKHLSECIESILTQSYKAYELFLIDGNSTDDTVNIIQTYSDKISYFISEPDSGIYDAWNKALLKAKGDWIVFIGADDVLHFDAFEVVIRHIINHPMQKKLEFVSSKIELVNEELSLIRIVGEPWVWSQFKRKMITWHVGAFHSKYLFKKYGIFDSTYKISGDYELLLRAKDKLITSFVDKTIVKMRLGGISDVRLHQASKETYHAKMKNEILSPYEGMLWTFVDSVRLTIRALTGRRNF